MEENKLKPCPFCGKEASEHISFDGFDPWYRIVCKSCRTKSVPHKSKDAAIEAWNRRDEPPNPSLTLDKLRGMVGDPVWLRGHGLNRWYIFNGFSLDGIPFFTPEIGYGKLWAAYRRRPEEGKHG